jgi:hypothetical protein
LKEGGRKQVVAANRQVELALSWLSRVLSELYSGLS